MPDPTDLDVSPASGPIAPAPPLLIYSAAEPRDATVADLVSDEDGDTTYERVRNLRDREREAARQLRALRDVLDYDGSDDLAGVVERRLRDLTTKADNARILAADLQRCVGLEQAAANEVATREGDARARVRDLEGEVNAACRERDTARNQLHDLSSELARVRVQRDERTLPTPSRRPIPFPVVAVTFALLLLVAGWVAILLGAVS